MNFGYLKNELYYRKRRTLTAILGLSIGIALLVIINALAAAYKEAARRPLEEIGADITVQRAGNVPEELKGPVFACSAVTIKKEEIARISKLSGIEGLGEALLIWVFDPDRFTIVLGVDPENPAGPGMLRHFVTAGRFIASGRSEALVEASYARDHGIKPGDKIAVAKHTFPVVGIVDASRTAKIAVANVYLPLPQARRLAAASPQVQKVSPFGLQDANILFIKADQRQVADLTVALKDILGNKASITTPESFLKLLGNLFALSDKFAVITSLIAIIVAVLIVVKTMAGNMAERAAEIGTLKAVGWSNRNVVSQMVAESITQCFLGGILGLAIAFLAAFALGFMQVHIPIPWEMSPSPHFLPGGGDPIFKTLRLPVHISWMLASTALIVSMLIGGITGAFLSRHISRIKPSEILRHE